MSHDIATSSCYDGRCAAEQTRDWRELLSLSELSFSTHVAGFVNTLYPFSVPYRLGLTLMDNTIYARTPKFVGLPKFAHASLILCEFISLFFFINGY